MNDVILNETPIRTSKNYNINNIKLNDDEIKFGQINDSKTFLSVFENYDKNNVVIDENIQNLNINYGISDELTQSANNHFNGQKRIIINGIVENPVNIEYKFAKENASLINKIQIIAKDDSKAVVVIKFISDDLSQNSINYFNNTIFKIDALDRSFLDVIILNFLNENALNLLTIDNKLKEKANINFTIIDLGGKKSITNYYSNLEGNESKNNLNTIYLGKGEQLFDLNYISHLNGEKSDVTIEVEGALADTSKKHFKGTIDFKKGAKKARGNENESCVLLASTAKSVSLPMLLCSEEDVEGNHSTSAGRLDDKSLFYIMTRGFSKKDAMKLVLRAKFNKILDNIEDNDLRKDILDRIDKKLD